MFRFGGERGARLAMLLELCVELACCVQQYFSLRSSVVIFLRGANTARRATRRMEVPPYAHALPHNLSDVDFSTLPDRRTSTS